MAFRRVFFQKSDSTFRDGLADKRLSFGGRLKTANMDVAKVRSSVRIKVGVVHGDMVELQHGEWRRHMHAYGHHVVGTEACFR